MHSGPECGINTSHRFIDCPWPVPTVAVEEFLIQLKNELKADSVVVMNITWQE